MPMKYVSVTKPQRHRRVKGKPAKPVPQTPTSSDYISEDISDISSEESGEIDAIKMNSAIQMSSLCTMNCLQ
jgi:hypothetical protein